MRAKLRNSWASAFAAIAILAATSGMATASSASAATPSAPSVNTRTCTFYHAHLGPTHDAIDASANRRLAWTIGGSSVGDPVGLEPYHDTLSQCFKFQFGFPNFAFEIEISTGVGLCVSENPKNIGKAFAPVELEPCMSKKTQRWVGYGTAARTHFESVANPNLCIGSDTSIQSGAVLYQETCRNTPRQLWYVNNNP